MLAHAHEQRTTTPLEHGANEFGIRAAPLRRSPLDEDMSISANDEQPPSPSDEDLSISAHDERPLFRAPDRRRRRVDARASGPDGDWFPMRWYRGFVKMFH